MTNSTCIGLKNEDLIENLAVGVLLLDGDLRITKANIAAETLFETSRRHLIGLLFEDLFDDEEVTRRVHAAFDHFVQYTLREVMLGFEGRELLLDMTLSPVMSVDGKTPTVLVELYSISRISRFIREANQLERQQSFRLMVRSLAHEIKNPLSGLRGAAQLLARELEDPNQHALSQILIKEVDRLTRLVDRVMGSRESLKLSSVNIHEVIEHVLDVVDIRQSKRVKIEREYDPTLPELKADKEQLVQALLNIVGNALEAQEALNVARIGIFTEFARAVTINQTLYKRAIKITVRDHGPGIAPELRELVFDPMITNKPTGTGLGLSITQEIVQRHNGVVQFEECDEHTCFVIYLPYT